MKKTVLITGASSGFGYEFVKLFARDGFNLILIARSLARLEAIKKEFPEVNITVIKKDLIKPDAVKNLFDEINEKELTVDVLVNNAGFGLHGKFDQLDVEQQLGMIDLNIRALTELTHYALQGMKERNEGKILNVASMAAFQPGPSMAVYFASKSYVLSFTEALYEELRGTKLTLSTLCPGAAKTNFGSVAGVSETKMFKGAMDASRVAKQGYKGLMNGKRVIIPGKSNKLSAIASKLLPRSVTTKVVNSITNKK
ncbi:SDR family NAD(P)-dependent oxidoreductase [Haloplasma contractile]|uniref:3-oxoacyl-acyl-carrier protein reductase n=1 Tax=Haloplasma contractile SSD-17B TaxID=1033810 RepID=F7Q1W7_9MOLU|nr:SDR family oxidoreductase [Haloplasma contractile]ERJ12222.1 3-oxoacyl-acyl-carrier protein reductase [Haloplasma contractile SSD-17B]